MDGFRVLRRVEQDLDRLRDPASTLSRPERLLGIHFFNPAPMMALVEIIRSITSSDETIAAARSFAETCGKSPVEVADRAGFIVNALLLPGFRPVFDPATSMEALSQAEAWQFSLPLVWQVGSAVLIAMLAFWGIARRLRRMAPLSGLGRLRKV